MAAATLDAPHARAHLRPGVRVSDSGIFRAAVTLIVLHIIDDWEVNSGHTQGLHDHPRQYAERVLSFFGTSLLNR